MNTTITNLLNRAFDLLHMMNVGAYTLPTDRYDAMESELSDISDLLKLAGIDVQSEYVEMLAVEQEHRAEVLAGC